jgi:D-alanine--poly(phosphoribitol) ligase subunit 2
MIRSHIVSYMESAFLFRFDTEVTDATDLFKAGIMDSYGYMQLMRFIQSAFGVKFSREELLSNVITSLAGIVTAVEARMAAKSLPAT